MCCIKSIYVLLWKTFKTVLKGLYICMVLRGEIWHNLFIQIMLIWWRYPHFEALYGFIKFSSTITKINTSFYECNIVLCAKLASATISLREGKNRENGQLLRLHGAVSTKENQLSALSRRNISPAASEFN
jgi:hypothetical protein